MVGENGAAARYESLFVSGGVSSRWPLPLIATVPLARAALPVSP